jgi:hypothetical protein
MFSPLYVRIDSSGLIRWKNVEHGDGMSLDKYLSVHNFLVKCDCKDEYLGLWALRLDSLMNIEKKVPCDNI